MKEDIVIDPERLWRGWQQHTPFQTLVWMELEAHDKAAGTVTLRLPYKPEYRHTDKPPTGYHGGVIASLIDVAGDFVVAIANDSGGGVPTINLTIDYLRSSDDTDLLARARIRRLGRTIAVVDIDVEEPNGRLIAVGRATYSTKTL
jgi:uncharacterized protein (TIGR00369 family)